MAELHSLIPMLKVNHIQNTIGFYTRVLGFELAGVWPDAEKPEWCKLVLGGAQVMFYEDPTEDQRPSLTGVLYIGTDDVMTIHGRIKDRVKIEWGPEVYEHGMREFAIRDCNGYLVSFGQEVEPQDKA